MLRNSFLSILLFALCCAAVNAADKSPVRADICLNGEWEVSFDVKDNSIPASGWKPVRVPSSWSPNGLLSFTYPDQAGSADTAAYRKSLPIPQEWNDGRRIKLKYYLIGDAHSILINGKIIKDSPNRLFCQEIDITDSVKFGKDNQLVIFTKKYNGKIHGSFDYGIVRNIYLLTRPKLSTLYSHVMPDLTNKKMTVRTKLKNESGENCKLTINYSVLDAENRKILNFKSEEIEMTPNSEKINEQSVSWENPVLWGFGEYGQAYLYQLKTELSGKTASDIKYDRFGFREFKTEGGKFYLNGKEFFIKGDLLTRNFIFGENPYYINAYYQRQRSININFQRMHSHHKSDFDAGEWYRVADETGFLVEPELSRYVNSSGIQAADGEEVTGAWDAYMNEYFNSPSIVMWCPDNESFSVGLASAETLQKVDIDKLKAYDNLCTFIRKKDPSRIVEIHHNYCIYPFIDQGYFNKENFTTFNIHPYGALRKRINAEAKAVGFKYEVPIVVGEVVTFPNIPAFIHAPEAASAEQWRMANNYYDQIMDAAKTKGVSGIILCSMAGDGIVGFKQGGDFFMGPWTSHAVIKDKSAPMGIGGLREFNVKVKWPSLSGEGTRPEIISPYAYNKGRFGMNINWFDSSSPIFISNIVDTYVAKAFKDVNSKEEAPMTRRAPEAVVCLGESGKPLPNTYIYVSPASGEGLSQAVISDKDGTGWFRFTDPGKYIAEATVNGKKLRKEFSLEAQIFSEKAGYGFVKWVDMGGIDPAKRIKELETPADFIDYAVLKPGEAAEYGSMENWSGSSSLFGWSGKLTKTDGCDGSGYGAKLSGSKQTITQNITLISGSEYKLTAWIRKDLPDTRAVVQVKDNTYKNIAEISASDVYGKWIKYEKTFTATGAEKFIYCTNYNGESSFDEISLIKISSPSKKQEVPFSPGPFSVSSSGFIRNWLVCGPFPNRGNEESGFEGYKTDWLEKYGGEVSILPVEGKKYEVNFPGDFYWKEGKAELSWRALESEKDLTSLDSIQLPEMSICSSPPTNVCAYIACFVESPSERELVLGIGSDDCYKIYLNGQKAGELVASRGSKPDQETYRVKLKKGKNILVIKMIQHVGKWNCFVRFLDKNGTPIKDLKILLDGDKK